MAAVPHYVTLAGGQVRVWRCGAGADLVALAGLTLSAADTAETLAGFCPAWRITVVELPGIGGSASVNPADADTVAATLAEAIVGCGVADCVLVASDAAAFVLGRVAARLPRRPHATIGIALHNASAWAALAPPPLAPRTDGTHLNALWTLIRDLHVLDPADRSQPARNGEAIPDADMLDRIVVAAAVSPAGYAAAWGACLSAAPADGVVECGSWSALPARLAGLHLEPGRPTLPRTAPLSDGAIWHDEVETARGRMHLRRAGGSGRPLLVIPTGGGSSAQFAPVVTGLARGRQAFSVDYLGNGLSDRPEREVDIGVLADDMLALVDALGFDAVDVWGSHTGALVGLELAVRHPERVGRAVLEGPVFISADFQHDLLENYFPRFRPDTSGLHLQLVWNWRRDMFLFWPWYRVAREAARQLGLPSPQHLHDYAIGILESGPGYDRAYRAAFSYDTAARLPLLTRPALICAGPNDMLIEGLAASERLAVPGVTVRTTPTTVWWPDPDPRAASATMAIYDAFLAG